MAIVAGFDVHRAQITFDALDTETGEVHRGRMRRRSRRRAAVGRRASPAAGATWPWRRARAGCSSVRRWRPRARWRIWPSRSETSALRGKKRRAKTDRADARWLRTLLAEGRLPEAWIPPAHVREWRTQTRLRKTLVDERTQWLQRIQATLFHHGIVNVPEKLRISGAARSCARSSCRPPRASGSRSRWRSSMRSTADRAARARAAPLARRQTGCQALMRQYGIGPLTAATILAELGDVSRLSASRKAVRCPGLDIGVHRSDRRSRTGRLTRQGSPQLRWALYEAAQSACKPASPDHADYLALKARGPLPHARVADHRAQARPPQLPHPARARPRRARPDPTT